MPKVTGCGEIEEIERGKVYRIRHHLGRDPKTGRYLRSPKRTVHGTKSDARRALEEYRHELEEGFANPENLEEVLVITSLSSDQQATAGDIADADAQESGTSTKQGSSTAGSTSSSATTATSKGASDGSAAHGSAKGTSTTASGTSDQG